MLIPISLALSIRSSSDYDWVSMNSNVFQSPIPVDAMIQNYKITFCSRACSAPLRKPPYSIVFVMKRSKPIFSSWFPFHCATVASYLPIPTAIAITLNHDLFVRSPLPDNTSTPFDVTLHSRALIHRYDSYRKRRPLLFRWSFPYY